MKRKHVQNILAIGLSTVGWPLIGGLILTVAFYLIIHQGWISNPLVVRYFAGHPVEYIETGLFFVGLAAIMLATFDVIGQFGSMHRIALPERGPGLTAIREVGPWLRQLQELSETVRDSYLGRRFRDALQFLERTGSAENLDAELKHLSDLAVEQQQERYALVRIVVWATPMLGFLGTVIGITMALGELSPTALVQTPEAAMESLLAGLSVAFDTTAIALSFSMVLMFCQFVTSRLESELLASVDARVNSELVGRFATISSASRPESLGYHDGREMSQAVDRFLAGTEEMLRQHDRRLEQTIIDMQKHWSRIADQTTDAIRSGLVGAMRDSVLDHAAVLARSEDDLQEKAAVYWNQLQHALQSNASVIQQQQVELARQGDIMMQVLRATGDVVSLQDALCQNLKLLRGRQAQVDAARATYESLGERPIRGERVA